MIHIILCKSPSKKQNNDPTLAIIFLKVHNKNIFSKNQTHKTTSKKKKKVQTFTADKEMIEIAKHVHQYLLKQGHSTLSTQQYSIMFSHPKLAHK